MPRAGLGTAAVVAAGADLADEIDLKIKTKLGVGVRPVTVDDLPAGVDPVTGEVPVDF